MPVHNAGIRQHWAAMKADPAWREQVATSRLRQAATVRPVALATASAAAPVQQIRAAGADSGRVNLYEEIAWYAVTAADFCAEIAQIPGDLTLGISSPGGDLMDALAIYSTLRQRPGTVTVVVDGLAASAASVIMCAASPGRLFVAEHSTAMIHDAFTVTAGNEQDHRDMADVLGRESDNIAGIYAARSGRPAGVMRDLMRAETWFIGAEIVAAGLADAVLPDGSSPPAPESWEYLAAQLTTKAQVTSAGPGRAGNPALRAQVYSRYAGRSQGRVSPFVAAVFRL